MELKLEIGDRVQETFLGYTHHCEHHGQVQGIPIKGTLGGIRFSTGIPIPKKLWRPKKGNVVEIQGRWFFQEGLDVQILWDNGEREWRLADSDHLVKI